MRRIGVLLTFAASDPEAQVRVRAFGQALQELGWMELHNVRIEYRFAAGDFDRMQAFAKELIEMQFDVIVTNALSPIMGARQQNRTVPIVFAMVPNPVDVGLMKSLSRPDKNMSARRAARPPEGIFERSGTDPGERAATAVRPLARGRTR
jgi:putative ABC transport system substrate-binding protein